MGPTLPQSRKPLAQRGVVSSNLTESVTAGEKLTVAVQPPGEYDFDAALAPATPTVGESLDLEPAFTFEPESPDVETEVSSMRVRLNRARMSRPTLGLHG